MNQTKQARITYRKSKTASKRLERMISDIIFKHVKDLVFIMKVEHDKQFRYLFANENGLLHAGMSTRDIGKTIEEVLPSCLANRLQKQYLKAAKTGKEVVFQDEVRLENDQQVLGETLLTPIKEVNGDVQYIVAVTRDITENFKEKHRLIESEQRYRSLVDHNLDAVFSIDLKGKILDVNPAAQMLTGYTVKQLKSKKIFSLICETDLQSFNEVLSETKVGNAKESLDCRFMHRQGQYLTVHLKTIPILIHSEITGMYVIIRDLTEQAESTELIKYMAFHDQLTGLRNRRALLDHLDDLVKRKQRSSYEFALLFLDIDRFKYLNDTLGHLVGDQILKQVAERLIDIQKEKCTVYRQGGDEFIIVLEDTDRQGAGEFAQKVLSRFNESFYFNSQEYYITPSIGISLFPNDGKDSETLIKSADEALYSVKEKGKAHYQFYRADMNSTGVNVITLEAHLRKAIERRELELYYQPQVNLITNEISSFEALLRWNNSELGFISPAEFIPLAEDTGLIIPIGNWVIDRACRQIKEWTEKTGKPIRIAVNISPKQFLQLDLVRIIKNAIDLYGIDPSMLEIEITEGAMQDTKETIPILKKLKDLGITISVDDFGTGYSSLSYLKKFPIDVLKIDQSFIRDIKFNGKDAAIITTIIHLGKSLGMEVIAEGVEEQSQVDFLTDAHCEKAQGFFFARPLSAEEAEVKFINKALISQ
ncbi:EAL domain-containing protein [Mesobacillus subterraneus]|uniref:sensor domain-containing protein n=1 Tax=Mesobacillus subterraneus TaxID=285983 RepID=UPI00204040DD|nr:EAL domain-containing protein [Mesobacillus subterraneus]MCM3663234.1 EAL domain-containing protein [Mesobacillus subterraneus]MCM3682593.1 EAL domain-containing protein [Mesobacillus subterraneus]